LRSQTKKPVRIFLKKDWFNSIMILYFENKTGKLNRKIKIIYIIKQLFFVLKKKFDESFLAWVLTRTKPLI
jgi:hypothetical protein